MRGCGVCGAWLLSVPGNPLERGVTRMKWRRIALAAVAVVALVPGSATAATPRRTPVVLFPAFHLTKLKVTVHDQTTAPGCPSSGSFEDWFQNDHPSTTFGQVCQDRLE